MRNNRRVSYDASVKVTADSGDPSSAQPLYRMITKRIRCRRTTLPRSASPWCRGKRPRYRNVIVYVDKDGKELSALDVHKRSKAGIPQSAADEEKKTENAASSKATKKSRPSASPRSETRSKRLSMNVCTTAADEAVAGSSVTEVCNQLTL